MMTDLLPQGDIAKPRAVMVSVVVKPVGSRLDEPATGYELDFEEALAVLALVRGMREKVDVK